MTKLFIGAGALLAGLSVVLGAFATHTLNARITPERLEVFETGVRYQMYHALALLFLSWAVAQWPLWQVTWAGFLFIAGILIFSGSLYVLVLTDTAWMGAITPLGGLFLIGGWLLLLWGAVRAV
jgi:uncharacterized membrane protein YgdD (TMEM256/DUF423 family)